MNDLHDDVLEHRLRTACHEMIPLLAHNGTVDDGDTDVAQWSDTYRDTEVVELDTFRRRPRRSMTSVLIGAAAAVMLMVGGLALLQRDDQPAPIASANGGTGTGTTQDFTFRTPTVSLSADSITVIDGDRTFSPTDAQVNSDPGDSTYTTFEVTWTEGGSEQRILIYFTSDGTNWWATEIRTYAYASDAPDWREPVATGTFFSTPLGAAYTGDLDLPNLRITGMTLQAFLPLDACEAPTAPIALVADYPEIVASAGGFGASLQLIDTTTCTALPDPRRAMLASPNRQATPTRPRSRPSACTKPQAASASAATVPVTPAQTYSASRHSPACQISSASVAATAGPYSASKRGLTGPRSRRSTRSGGTSRSRSSGGRPKPSRVTKPVASAGRIGCQDGAGSSPLPSSWPSTPLKPYWAR